MASGDHIYLSTYCFHGEHDSCRLVCKMCSAPCVCACHDGDPAMTDAAHDRAMTGRILLMLPVER